MSNQNPPNPNTPPTPPDLPESPFTPEQQAVLFPAINDLQAALGQHIPQCSQEAVVGEPDATRLIFRAQQGNKGALHAVGVIDQYGRYSFHDISLTEPYDGAASHYTFSTYPQSVGESGFRVTKIHTGGSREPDFHFDTLQGPSGPPPDDEAVTQAANVIHEFTKEIHARWPPPPTPKRPKA